MLAVKLASDKQELNVGCERYFHPTFNSLFLGYKLRIEL